MKIKRKVMNPCCVPNGPKGIWYWSQVSRAWLDGKERWVFVIEERIIIKNKNEAR